MKKKIIIITALIIILAFAGIVLATKIIIKADNKDFKQDPDFYKSLGNYFAEQGENDKAIQAYETSLLLGEDHEVRNNLAILFHKQSRYSEAINQLRILTSNEPKNPSYHYDLAINLVDRFRNSQEQSLSDLTEALAEYELVEELKPGYSHASENIEVLKKVLKMQ